MKLPRDDGWVGHNRIARGCGTATALAGVSFEEARTIFGDPLSLTVADQEHEEGEFRFAIVGRTIAGRLVVVSHVERGDTIRIISARPADRREKKAYEESQNDRAGA